MCRTAAEAAATPAPHNGAPRVGLADIFRSEGPGFRRTHRLSRAQLRAMRAIERCRTAALGGRAESCDRCGAVRIRYNSCRNRHCPLCQTPAQQRWLAARRAELLPVEYFHVVFTLPHALNSLAQGNPRVIYNLLFEAASGTLRAFGDDPTHLGGRLGVTAVLHTWGRNLSQHVHLHCIVTGGGLSPDGSRWIPAQAGFLFPVRAMSKVFRGKFLQALRRAFDAERLRLPGKAQDAAASIAFARLVAKLREQDWVVYCKRPLAGPQQVLDYLARYTHRVAISNERLVCFADGLVRFRWKDYADAGQVKIMTLRAEEFLRRFLLHVVPDGFMRIRHFGLLANRRRADNLRRCWAALHVGEPQEISEESTSEMMRRLTGEDLEVCPVCRQGRMRLTEFLPPTGSYHPPARAPDTS
jgi:hypothetical protein